MDQENHGAALLEALDEIGRCEDSVPMKLLRDADGHAEALIAERDAAIARAEKAEEQRDRARAWGSRHHGALCRDGGPCNCERLAALSDDPPEAQP